MKVRLVARGIGGGGFLAGFGDDGYRGKSGRVINSRIMHGLHSDLFLLFRHVDMEGALPSLCGFFALMEVAHQFIHFYFPVVEPYFLYMILTLYVLNSL